jgi:hypothetical protein
MLDIVLIALCVIFIVSTVYMIVEIRRDRMYERLYFQERKKWDELYKSYIELYKENKYLKNGGDDN